jgi:exodeoxyribonuclease VII small subunit
MAKKKETRLTLEEALEKLDNTVERMQSEEISLEESFQAYKEGMEYVRFCNETIDQIEKKVLVLNQEGQWDELEE